MTTKVGPRLGAGWGRCRIVQSMGFSVAADHVLDGCWTVVDHTGAVALMRRDRRPTRPAVFRSRDEAVACARRLNDHLPLALDD